MPTAKSRCWISIYKASLSDKDGLTLPSQITISTAAEQDIPALCGLLKLLFEQEAEFKADLNAQQRGLQAIISNPSLGEILLARSDETVVGMVNLLFSVSTALGGKVAWLEDMLVHPDWRNQGIGSQLLQQAITDCRKQGLLRITLLTDSDNAAAQRFYRKHGFNYSTMQAMRCLLEP